MKWKKSDRIALLTSLVFAIILWTYVMNQENPQMSREIRNIPVTLLNVDDLEQKDLVILEPTAPTVNVTLAGLRNTLYGISPDQIIAEVDLKGYEEGMIRVPVVIRQPAETAVARISTPEILFSVEKIVERTIDIDAMYDEGTPVEDFKYNITTDPKMVTFKASRTLANRVHRAEVAVDLAGKKDSFTTNQKVTLLDSSGAAVPGIDIQDEMASVSVEVRRVKDVPIVIAHTGTLPAGVTIQQERIEPNSIRVAGPDALIQNLESIRTEPIDYADLTASGNKTVQLQFPDGISEDEVLTPVYSVTVRTPVEQSFVIGRSAVQIRNLAQGLHAVIEDGNAVLTRLTGDESKLQDLTEQAVSLYVDAKGLTAGTHEVPVQMDVIEGISREGEELPVVNLIVTDAGAGSATDTP